MQVPDVRLNVISNLEHAQALLGAEALQASVLPALDDLVTDPHWRVRHAVIGALPLLARQLGVETYEERLLPRSREWLHDPVATIRDSAMESFVAVGGVFGEAWAAEKAVPMLLQELENPYYLFRITCIQARAPDACCRTVLRRARQLPVACCWDCTRQRAEAAWLTVRRECRRCPSCLRRYRARPS